MIYTDSRYATGNVYYAGDARYKAANTTVSRKFPSDIYEYFAYTWTSEDRVDLVAYKFLGSSGFWWILMDANPEIINPFSIAPGTVLRIPSA